MLRVVHPPTRPSERAYITAVLLRDFLGLDYRTAVGASPTVEIQLDGDQRDRRLMLPDCLFATPEPEWLTPAAMPEQPLRTCDVPDWLASIPSCPASLPILFGDAAGEAAVLDEGERTLRFAVDIFGSTFFFLTRYEEIVRKERDGFDRFSTPSSIAFQEGILHRPIVNEYVELLWAGLSWLWPGMRRKSRAYRLLLTHDTDAPTSLAWPALSIFKQGIVDLIIRKDPSLALAQWSAGLWGKIKRRPASWDPVDTHDFIMNVSEQHGLTSEFYFLADRSSLKNDSRYDPDDPEVRTLIRCIHRRGHRIGYHGSLRTYLDPRRTQSEFEHLKAVCRDEGVEQEQWGGRQHFLKWSNPATWQNWHDAGLDYDSTVGFADQVGFRSGTCYPYPAFNLLTRTKLNVIEHPLMFMEVTLFRRLTPNSMPQLDIVLRLRDECRRYGGELVILWHNTTLVSPIEKATYADLIRAVAS